MTQTLERETVQVPFEFNALTTCDRHPSARAYTRFYKGELELLFCKHCSDKMTPTFVEKGWNVDDQTSILDGEIEAYNSKAADSDF